jgi:hypothetical protein
VFDPYANAVLAVAVVAKVFRWDDNVRVQRQSRWFTTVHTESYLLKRSLNDGRAYSTHAGYLPFYGTAEAFAALAGRHRVRVQRGAGRRSGITPNPPTLPTLPTLPV